MHVLIIRTASAIGGAEIYNLNLIKGFKDYFPSVRFSCVTNYPEFGKRLEKENVPVKVIPFFNEEIGTKKGLLRLIIAYVPYLFKYLSAIRQINKINRIDLVVLQSTTEKLALTFVLSLIGFKIIWLEHGPFFEFSTTGIILTFYKIITRYVNIIITVSKDTYNNLIKYGLDPSFVRVVYVGVQVKDKFLLNSFCNDNNARIVFFGSVSAIKGIYDFINIAIKINRQEKKIKFYILGAGRDLLDCINLVNKNKLAKYFRFLGYVENPVRKLYNFDIVLNPTHHLEGFSIAMLEASSVGLPIIARDIGGNRELVVHGETGYLFKDESEEEIANMVIDLIRNPKKRMAMGRAARARVRKYFSAERWIRQMNDLFEEVSGE